MSSSASATPSAASSPVKVSHVETGIKTGSDNPVYVNSSPIVEIVRQRLARKRAADAEAAATATVSAITKEPKQLSVDAATETSPHNSVKFEDEQKDLEHEGKKEKEDDNKEEKKLGEVVNVNTDTTKASVSPPTKLDVSPNQEQPFQQRTSILKKSNPSPLVAPSIAASLTNSKAGLSAGLNARYTKPTISRTQHISNRDSKTISAPPPLTVEENVSDNEIISKADIVNLEQKLQVLMSKTKRTDDRMRKVEKDASSNIDDLKSTKISLEQLNETQKNDRKLILQLREQLAAVRARIDQFSIVDSRQKDTKKTFSYEHHHKKGETGVGKGKLDSAPEKFDISALNEVIRKTVKEEVASRIDSALKKHTAQIMRQVEESNVDKDSVYNQQNASNNINQQENPLIQKEILRLRADFERLRSRQAYLDDIYVEFKENTLSRQAYLEEEQKKSISNHNSEFNKLLQTVGSKVNDIIASIKIDTDTKSLREDFQRYKEMNDECFTDISERITTLNRSQEQLLNTLNKQDAGMSILQERISSTDKYIEDITKDMSQYDSLSKTIECHSNRITAQDEVTRHLKDTIAEKEQQTDKLAAQITSLFDALKELETKIDDKNGERDKHMANRIQELEKSVDQVSESRRGTLERLKQLNDFMMFLSTAKKSTDEVLQEVQNRSKKDSTTMYEMKEMMTKFDTRLSNVDNIYQQVELVKAEIMANNEQSKVELNKDIQKMKDYNNTLKEKLVEYANQTAEENIKQFDVFSTTIYGEINSIRDNFLKFKEEQHQVGDEVKIEYGLTLQEMQDSISDLLSRSSTIDGEMIGIKDKIEEVFNGLEDARGQLDLKSLEQGTLKRQMVTEINNRSNEVEVKVRSLQRIMEDYGNQTQQMSFQKKLNSLEDRLNTNRKETRALIKAVSDISSNQSLSVLPSIQSKTMHTKSQTKGMKEMKSQTSQINEHYEDSGYNLINSDNINEIVNHGSPISSEKDFGFGQYIYPTNSEVFMKRQLHASHGGFVSDEDIISTDTIEASIDEDKETSFQSTALSEFESVIQSTNSQIRKLDNHLMRSRSGGEFERKGKSYNDSKYVDTQSSNLDSLLSLKGEDQDDALCLTSYPTAVSTNVKETSLSLSELKDVPPSTVNTASSSDNNRSKGLNDSPHDQRKEWTITRPIEDSSGRNTAEGMDSGTENEKRDVLRRLRQKKLFHRQKFQYSINHDLNG